MRLIARKYDSFIVSHSILLSFWTLKTTIKFGAGIYTVRNDN